jgi:hypothetical protein
MDASLESTFFLLATWIPYGQRPVVVSVRSGLDARPAQGIPSDERAKYAKCRLERENRGPTSRERLFGREVRQFV